MEYLCIGSHARKYGIECVVGGKLSLAQGLKAMDGANHLFGTDSKRVQDLGCKKLDI